MNAIGSSAKSVEQVSEPSVICSELPRLLLTPAEGARALSIGRTTLYALMRRGELGFVYAGGVRRIPVAAIHQFVERELRRQGFQT